MTGKNTYSIEVEISPTGEIQSTVKGIEGAGCEALTEWMDELGKTVEHYRTPDHSRDQTRRTVTQVRH